MTREIYPHPPVVLVAVEARHPDAAPMTEGQQSEIKRLLAPAFPLPQPAHTHNIVTGLGGPPSVTELTIPRFASRDQATAVTFGPQALVVETTKHRSFEHLVEVLRTAVEARQRVAGVEGLLRLGLRYVDEIRVPDQTSDDTCWGEWVHASLIGPSTLGPDLGLSPQTWEGATVFDRGDGRQLILRYGPRQGFAVAPGGPLHRVTPAPGAFFLMDIDSFWVATSDVPEFTPGSVVERCVELHEPISALFERLITEKLKREVLRDA